jgi:predicted lipoprotein with Yx(FWY)xxD motif
MRIARLVPVGLLGLACMGVTASQAAATTHIAPASRHAAAAAATIQVRSTAYGKILVNSKGFTLYLFAKDKKNKSTCSGQCLAVWPLVLVKGKPTAGPGLKASLLGTIKEPGGKNEVTYNGWPLYTFVPDIKPGDVTGEGNTSFGAPWWVVSPAGTAIKKMP